MSLSPYSQAHSHLPLPVTSRVAAPMPAASSSKRQAARQGRLGNMLYSSSNLTVYRREKDSDKFSSVPKFEAPQLFSWRFILAIIGWCSGLAIFGYALHYHKNAANHRAQQEDVTHFKIEDVMKDIHSEEMLASRMKTTKVFESLEQRGHAETSVLKSEIMADMH